MTSQDSSVILAEHYAAMDAFLAVAASIPDARWTTPRAAGKWTPAQEIEHLALAYEAFGRELSGGPSLRPIGKRWQRMLWRLVAMHRILRTGELFRAVPAPREIRPGNTPAPREQAMTRLRTAVAEFERIFSHAWKNEPTRQLTHPYFGGLSLKQSARFSAVHTNHHKRFLELSRAGTSSP